MLLSTAMCGRVERDRAVALVDLADEDIAVADDGAGERRVGRDEVLHHRAVHDGRDRGPARCRIQPIMPVVVDLPLVPATPMLRRAALNSSASSCGAGDQAGAPTRRAACTSGTVSSTAAEVTTIWSGPVTPLPSCGNSAMPRARRKSNFCARAALVERAVGARDRGAPGLHDQRERQHAAAADAAEEIGSVSIHRRKL